ncbi:ABC transporter ATP-binding protein [Microcoleus sp. FACHB-1515]|uniref:ABC transporter ATP-binding protein n=1 Tax=Cyanophyceae TaxID=3028117 RepID=UPI0016885397|nr:ABC transporter ATP-binding protein [Microcoleus sp. FACHB-1515]MBD2088475.1 ABC transporter ATP-binding protein [Microcoleus sp. FACHB-1515]
MAEPLIELKKVSKTFGNNVVLDEVDLTIYRGEALAVIGPSGTGKSTILRIIAGLLAPDAGEVWVQGVRRQGLAEDGQDPIVIGMVFQQAALFDSLNVYENVGFRLYQHSRLSAKRIRDLVNQKLDLVGLPGIGDRFPAELSGGMRKRVSFARAIMENPDDPQDHPEILLYDEPTAGLDPIASTVIEDLIRSIQQHSKGCSTYVMVTHQDSTIRRTADRIVFLYRGKVRWEGVVSDIDTVDNLLVRQFFSGSIDGPIQVAG